MGFINTGEIGQHKALLRSPIIPACAEPRPPVNRLPASVTLLQPVPGLQQYREALASHDWAFEWSDDSRVVNIGRARLQYLVAMQPEVDPDFAVWNSIAPAGYRAGEAPAPSKAEVLRVMGELIDAASDTLDYSKSFRGAIARAHTVWAQASGVAS